MARPQLAKAVLIPMNGDQPESDQSQYILVQFNPNSLRLGLSNTLKADNKGGSSAAAQYIDKSESSMSVQLVFDTTVARDASQNFEIPENGAHVASAKHDANTDVRLLTKAIADKFMKSPNPSQKKPSAPTRCRFQWGAFVFVGMLSSYDETLDFFSPEGIPLRATLALTFKEDRYQFETLQMAAGTRSQPDFSAPGETPADEDPEHWRDIALYNGIENPRMAVSAGLALPTPEAQATSGLAGGAAYSNSFAGGSRAQLTHAAPLSSQAQVGFSTGASASLGTDIPGAFGAGTVTANERASNGMRTSMRFKLRQPGRDN